MRPERWRRLNAVLDRRQADLTVVMDDVHKGHNLAAVLRTCDAVGVLEVHAVSPGGEVSRHRMRAGGSDRWVPVRLHRDTAVALAPLKARGFQVIAAHLTPVARDFRAPDYTRPTAFLLGAELSGVSPAALALADDCVSVPMHGHVASLNVSVVAAVLLYEAERQRAAQPVRRPRGPDPATRADRLFEWAYPRLAAWCRANRRPYPPLDPDGALAGDPRLPHQRPGPSRN